MSSATPTKGKAGEDQQAANLKPEADRKCPQRCVCPFYPSLHHSQMEFWLLGDSACCLQRKTVGINRSVPQFTVTPSKGPACAGNTVHTSSISKTQENEVQNLKAKLPAISSLPRDLCPPNSRKETVRHAHPRTPAREAPKHLSSQPAAVSTVLVSSSVELPGLPGSVSDASGLRNPPPDPSTREGKDSAFTRDAREAVRK